MTRIRPTEHKAVMALLDAPADSVADLATDVILALDELRARRTDFVAVVRHSASHYAVYGPYLTAAAARRDMGKSVVASQEGETFMILPLSGHPIDEGVLFDE